MRCKIIAYICVQLRDLRVISNFENIAYAGVRMRDPCLRKPFVLPIEAYEMLNIANHVFLLWQFGNNGYKSYYQNRQFDQLCLLKIGSTPKSPKPKYSKSQNTRAQYTQSPHTQDLNNHTNEII